MLLNIDEVEIKEYYSTYCGSGAVLLGYLKVEDQDEHSYFSCPSESHGRVVPVFDRTEFRYKVFDKASRKTVEYRGNFHFDSEVQFDEERLAKEKPYVLFFVGCDDGHTGMRFATREKMIEFLELVDTYDDVIDLCGKNVVDSEYFLYYHN